MFNHEDDLDFSATKWVFLLNLQSCNDLEKFANKMEQKLQSEDVGRDLASVNALMKTLNSHQDEIEIRKQEVEELQRQGVCCVCV